MMSVETERQGREREAARMCRGGRGRQRKGFVK
jgi:hypothetical protein